jgi:hypothetical protein
MTAIVWDRLEDRRFETGIERGVLYPGGAGVAWNGLVSVVESPGREAKVYYQDGLKTLIRLVAPGYKAKITAFTYPAQLDWLQGNEQIAPGVNLHDQREGSFDLSYRTRIGTAVEGVDYGYKLHLIYGLVINPSDTTHESMAADKMDPASFEWDVEAAQRSWGSKGVNHISIDSRAVDPGLLASIESQLYGTAETDPVMPDLVGLLNSLAG